jgi:Cd2+/Zn2+-exporting ATPase
MLSPPSASARASAWRWLLSDASELPVAFAAGLTLALGYLLWRATDETVSPITHNAGHALVWISLALGAIHGTRTAWESLRAVRPDIDVLMIVAAVLAAIIGHPEEGALLLFMFTLAGALENRALARTKDAVSRLHKLMPSSALRRSPSRDWINAAPEQLRSDDVVLVRPGATVPADGVVLIGRSAIDQSSLTGESFPRNVGPGDQVFAGTINREGPFEARVLRPVTESSITRILKLVIEAQEARQPMQRVIDRLSTPYAATVMLGTLLSLFVFRFAIDMSWADAGYRAITLLVVASPCALVIATPTATLCGLSRAARAGVLIKGGDALERLAGITRVAIDKTGTLTRGQIEVTHVAPVAGSDIESLLRIAMAVEQRSTHPIAAAVVRLAREHSLHPAELATLTRVAGQGIEGTYQGKPVRIGNYAFCEPMIPVCFRRHTQQMVERIVSGGGKAIVIAHDEQALVLSLADTPREGAEELAGALRDVGVDSVTMLTGDSRVIAERLARDLGIENVHAELLPDDKVEEIRKIRATSQSSGAGGGLAVVGDGVNDAPALAVADVGLAMGGIGADAALETADVVLLHDDLNRVPWSFGLARRVRRIMIANLVFAIGVIIVLATFTVIGKVPLPVGVIGHEGSTLLVVANSLRLLGHRAPK